MGEDLFLRQHLLAILHEIAQQLILNFAEVDLFFSAEHLRSLPVDRDAAARHRRARRLRLQNAANARPEHRQREGLRHVIGDAKLQRLHFVHLGIARCQHEHRRRTHAVQLCHEVKSAAIRQIAIEQQQIPRRLLEQRSGVAQRPRLCRFVSLQLQRKRQPLAQIAVVFDDEDLTHFSSLQTFSTIHCSHPQSAAQQNKRRLAMETAFASKFISRLAFSCARRRRR